MKVSPIAYSWIGFCSVLVLPSPNSQFQEVIIPLPASDSSVNPIIKFDPECVKSAVGGLASTVRFSE